jgi:hypothetical protein
MTQKVRLTLKIVKNIQFITIVRNPWWALTMHLPWIFKCLVQVPFTANYKNSFFNSKIYDGMTRNDFIKGEFTQFLFKLKIIKRFDWDHDDGRGYFIGYLDDE